MEGQTSSFENEPIVENKELTIWEALIPVIALIGMLAFNVFVFGDDALSGSNQFILLMGGAVAAVVGYFNKVEYTRMIDEVANNVQSTTGAILILLLVGSLAGTWMISGIIPTMIYYGLQILNPTIFLAACVIICSVISVATGSSWTTSATVGIALIGIAEALGISVGMTAGAILSGAYFGDKLSPLSDTTNLAPAMAGTDLFTHVRYMTLTTVPTITVTIIIFIIIGLNLDVAGNTDVAVIQRSIENSFTISPWLFVVPLLVIVLIIKKTSPLIALLIGTLLGAAAALIFQPVILAQVAGVETLDFISGYRGIMEAITVETSVVTDNEDLNDLFSSGGMAGMLGTIWLIICAMVFGGIMEAIGALATISRALLNMFHTTNTIAQMISHI